MAAKVIDDPAAGEVLLVKSPRSRRISIRVHPVRGVTVTLPRFCSYADGERVFAQKREWVLETLQRLREDAERYGAGVPALVQRLREEASALLPGKLSLLAARYGFSYGRVCIKHNSSNWGSCSARGNINLNLNLVRLPEPLCDYVLLHELCHLRYLDHGPRFHELLERLCADNLGRLASCAGPSDSVLPEIIASVGRSRARFPVQHVLKCRLKAYRLI